MINISATAVALELLENLSEASGQVHSCFEHGFNIRVDGEKSAILCFIGNRKDQKTAYGILIDQQEMPVLMRRVSPAITNLFWDKDKCVLFCEHFTISLDQAQTYSSRLVEDVPLRRSQLFPVVNFIEHKLNTGFELTIGEVLNLYREQIGDLYQAFQEFDEQKIQMSLKKWIGRGQGLTPSGDDVLMGMLYVNQLFPFMDSNFRRALKALIDQGFTTDISKHYYYCAFQGYFSQSLLELTQALKTHNIRKKNIDKIIEFGSTSGCDTLLGILLGIRYIEKNYIGKC